MRYQRIPSQLFQNNRKRFYKEMKANCLAVFNSNDIITVSADSTAPFRQHSDIFYLSGADQEESILVLFPDHPDAAKREILFLKETSEEIAIWEGEKLSKKEAERQSGIKTILWLDAFEKTFNELMLVAKGVYLNNNEHLRANTEAQTREDRFIKTCTQKYPNHVVHKSAPILHSLRAVKSEIELSLMQKACDITEKGLRRILNTVKPGMLEYELEAEIIHEFIKNGSRRFAYQPIIASGANACVLHYIENAAVCKKGELILFDFGAEYANYCADLSRTIPVSGKFTERQKQVYTAVLKVKESATELLRPGVLLKEYALEVNKIMESELLAIGLISKADIQSQDPKNPAYRKYFMHGVSHFIGLDTHDYGHWDEPIKENMCFTVEPGIYIRKEGLGIRLEDNVVVQATGSPKNLMANIPIEIEEIEDIMARGKKSI